MFEQVRPDQLDAWLAQFQDGPQPLLLDVREPFEWQTASVRPDPRFELRQLSMGNIPSELQSLDPERPTLCLCHHGMRSMSVAAFLARAGFESLANLQGGIDAWSVDFDPAVPRY